LKFGMPQALQPPLSYHKVPELRRRLPDCVQAWHSTFAIASQRALLKDEHRWQQSIVSHGTGGDADHVHSAHPSGQALHVVDPGAL
jgi:hypothetical protein